MMSEPACRHCGAPSTCFTRVHGSDWNEPVCDACALEVNTIIDRGTDAQRTTETIDLFIWATLTCILIILLGLAVLMMS